MRKIKNFLFAFFSAIWLVLLVVSCDAIQEEEYTILAIQPLEYEDSETLNWLKDSLENRFNFRTYVLENQNLPEKFITLFKGKRYQASPLLEFLNSNKADSVDYVLGFTSQDICITKYDEDGNIQKPENKYRDFGIFGLGYRPGEACVVSENRLKRNKGDVNSRILKVSIHEIGHNLGLEHCTQSKDCVMQSAVEKLSTVDHASSHFCPYCKAKINF